MVCPAHVTGNVRQQRTPDLCFYTCAPCFYGLLHMYNFKYDCKCFNVLKPLNMCPSAPHVALKQNVASVPANHAMQAGELTLPM